ncbi:hypothetical protein [Neisseria sicca]
MKKTALLLCLLMSAPAFAGDKTIDLKKISQLGADIFDSATQGVYKTISESSKTIANSECAIPTTAAELEQFSVDHCLKEPAMAGSIYMDQALKQKGTRIDEGARSLENLSNKILEGEQTIIDIE